jgi:hypothetical protein
MMNQEILSSVVFSPELGTMLGISSNDRDNDLFSVF